MSTPSSDSRKFLLLAGVGALGLLTPAGIMLFFLLGKGGVADRVMDHSPSTENLAPGRPVHPPRGERTHKRSSKALEMSSEALECTGGEVVKTNVRIQTTASFGVRVQPGCKLTLVNVDLTAPNGVLLDGGDFTMKGGSITTQGMAIQAKGDATVSLTNVKVDARDAIDARGMTQVVVTGGALHGTQNAVRATDRASVTVTEVDVVGPIRKNGVANVQQVGGTYTQVPQAEHGEP